MLIKAGIGKRHFGTLHTSCHMEPRRSVGRGHSLFAEQVDNSRLGVLCTDRSSDSGVDQSHGGAPKAGSTRRFSRTGWSLARLTDKGSRGGGGIEAERGGLGPRHLNSKRWTKKGDFQDTPQLPVRRDPDHEGYVHGV